MNAIGRALDVSGPALYRYFTGRDELLTALIVDAYDDLQRVTSAAVATRRTPRTRLAAFTRAYRAWALDQPHRYRLLYRAPLPGYYPNADALVRASHTMILLLDVIGIEGWLARRDLPRELAPSAHRALTVRTRLHGLVGLELEGDFASMGIDPNTLYDDAIAVCGEGSGRP